MSATVIHPTRFRAAEERNARIGRPLRLVAGVRETDPAMLEQIAVGFGQRDELGARLAAAMRKRPDDPERVSMAQFRTALADGVDAVPGAAPALREFLEVASHDPAWLDRGLVEEGARAFRRFGRNAADALLQLSLIGGYRFGGPPDLLAATGLLAGDGTRRRLAETQSWVVSVTSPGGLEVGAPGWRTTAHVRAMHALVNRTFESRWDVERWGLPINQSDQAGTLGLFDGTLLIGVRALGVPVSAEDSRAVMHLWKYVGWLMGVDEKWLVDTERERHAMNYHVVLAQEGQTEAGAQLSRDIVAVLGTLPHGRFQVERNLSMLSLFLGRESMRDLGLSWRPPWAHAAIWVRNTGRYRLVGRLPGGRERLEQRGAAEAERILASYYGSDDRSLADLPHEGEDPHESV